VHARHHALTRRRPCLHTHVRQLAALALWLRARSVDVSRVRFARTPTAGCSLVAAADSEPGSALLSLPLESEAARSSGGAQWLPVAITSELVLATQGPLGAAGRALAAVDGVARVRR
jgi:hypothetical protein